MWQYWPFALFITKNLSSNEKWKEAANSREDLIYSSYPCLNSSKEGFASSLHQNMFSLSPVVDVWLLCSSLQCSVGHQRVTIFRSDKSVTDFNNSKIETHFWSDRLKEDKWSSRQVWGSANFVVGGEIVILKPPDVTQPQCDHIGWRKMLVVTWYCTNRCPMLIGDLKE